MGVVEQVNALLESIQACILEENKGLKEQPDGRAVQKTLARKEALLEEVVLMSARLREGPLDGEKEEYPAVVEKIRKVLMLAYENNNLLERLPRIQVPEAAAPASALNIYRSGA